jgi:hypothetical protein
MVNGSAPAEVLPATPSDARGVLGPLGLVTLDGTVLTTVQKYSISDDEGNVTFTSERERLHEAIVEHFLSGKTAVAQRVAISTAGPPAVGKSTLLGGLHLQNLVVNNSDEILSLLPEYQALVQAHDERASTLTIVEAGMVAARLRAGVARRHLNVAIDTTGDSEPGSFTQTLGCLHDAGYAVEVKYVDAPTDEAWRRQLLRANRTGRWIPWSYFAEMHVTVPRRLFDVMSLPWAAVEVYDNSGRRPIRIMSRPANGRMHVSDADKLARLLAKGVSVEQRPGVDASANRVDRGDIARAPEADLSAGHVVYRTPRAARVENIGSTPDPDLLGFMRERGMRWPC